ncbi:MAG: arginine--tRNA ligase [Candidatus Puniceispirillales bacterium]|jgi:arginyl-tRNA synthetase|nr:arginine--tRNA ligase [Alphaproteobacteria bacterium]MBL6851165.1 arginine--tRNA ligase [Alphaproteobacteria bacterium]
MNVYKIYLDQLTQLLFNFKSDNNLTFDFNEILTKLTLEPPKSLDHGDMSTNLAMILSKYLSLKPIQIANMFIGYIAKLPGVDEVNVAGPGFINIKLTEKTWNSCLKSILSNEKKWDATDLGNGKKINIEYISANPTGPLHAGHTRGAVFGDALASLLKEVGYEVTKEYYINDAGSQIDKLVNSALLRYEECLGKKIKEIPEGLYPGEYLKEVGQKLVEQFGSDLKSNEPSKVSELVRQVSLDVIMKIIRNDLLRLGIEMDVYTSEKEIISGSLLEKTLSILEDKDLIYKGILDPPKGTKPKNWEEREQLLFKSSNFGDDTDRALKKSDGSWTYFATDMAYHLDKINRTNGNLINVLGADHIGYISRINAAVQALSDGSISIDTKVCSLVNLLEDGKPVKMSKRSGNFVTLSDIIDAVGKDVIRFIMLTRRNDQSLDFDFKKVTEKSKDNPVFYVQYAHARCNSIFKSANVLEKDLLADNFSNLTTKEEIELIKFISLWPRSLELAAKNHEPHRLCYYLIELSSLFHSLWNKGKDDQSFKFIIDNNKKLTNSRLCLVKAVAMTIRKGLKILSIEPVLEM